MPLNDDQIRRIAEHTFEKEDRVHRFNKEKYGPPMNIARPDDLAALIRTAARDANTEYVVRAEGGYLMRQPETNLTVLADGQGGGTAYRDRRFERDFQSKINEENELREKQCLPPAEKVVGPVPLERDLARQQAQERMRETLRAQPETRSFSRTADKDRSQ